MNIIEGPTGKKQGFLFHEKPARCPEVSLRRIKIPASKLGWWLLVGEFECSFILYQI
ncbi:MAG: hypothetical protein P0Y49_18990 [Candidatus Pedobacter colombiensis]|uniref:Uncharacterized protein n=1 Tax=Candidatus Pedobacter colombiensis TaxID=3121371 RepID=A0AAJ5W866_9SPHI|nr:hypothetical protein [Pedobacter sp.]WEK18865.1 MAG: hypothetical protein P0Y49_18990 [Pedobacter sp.]